MKNVAQSELFVQLEKHLSGKGCFLVAGKDQPNFMTIGWATAGIMWGKPVVMVAYVFPAIPMKNWMLAKSLPFAFPRMAELTKNWLCRR